MSSFPLVSRRHLGERVGSESGGPEDIPDCVVGPKGDAGVGDHACYCGDEAAVKVCEAKEGEVFLWGSMLRKVPLMVDF